MSTVKFEVVKAWEVSNVSRTLVVAIPKRVREKLNLEKGARFILTVEEGKIILEPLRYEERRSPHQGKL
mgnify:CR=1 FL=1